MQLHNEMVSGTHCGATNNLSTVTNKGKKAKKIKTNKQQQINFNVNDLLSFDMLLKQ